jgi:hypothetical protein
MIYIASIGIPTCDGLDTICSQRNSDSNIDYTGLFCPSQSYMTLDGIKFERRYLRIMVKNTGFGKATNCEAKMQIIPSNDRKQLVWDRSSTSGVLRDIFIQKNIRARKGEELVHVLIVIQAIDFRFYHNYVCKLSKHLRE